MTIDANTRETLIAIVREAGRDIVMPYFRQLEGQQVQQKSVPTDLVTIADQACERQISARIAAAFPDWVIVGEEAVAAHPEHLQAIVGADICVIIDPIDGTWNYANGLSNFGTILAVVVKGETQFGLLYDPDHDDWVYAHKGQGAYFQRPNQVPIKLQITQETEVKSLIGILSLHGFKGEQQRHLALSAPLFQRYLSLASCHAYRQIALGLFHFNLNYQLMPWDHAAGVLVVQEAGGVARTLTGEDYHPMLHNGQLLVAQSEAQWQQLVKLLNPR